MPSEQELRKLEAAYADTQWRECTVQVKPLGERAEGEDDSREVELSFSSEYEVERWDIVEVLEHKEGSVKLDRLNDGAPFLVQHRADDQVGVIVKARLDKDKVCRAIVRFSKSARAEEIYQDIVDGIRTKISVGYRVREYKVEKRKGLPDLVRVTQWEPNEISTVSMAADPSVGPGRSLDTTTETQPIRQEDTQMGDENKTTETQPKADEARTQAAAAPVQETRGRTCCGRYGRCPHQKSSQRTRSGVSPSPALRVSMTRFRLLPTLPSVPAMSDGKLTSSATSF